MCTDTPEGAGPPDRATHPCPVQLSRWINEQPPSVNELLSAREVARLTRRHRWLLTALALVGWFPPRQRFRGRFMGWRRGDVVDWLERRRQARRRRARACAQRRPSHCLRHYLHAAAAVRCAGKLAPRQPRRRRAVRSD